MENVVLYIAAPAVGMLLDWLYFDSMIHIIRGSFPVKEQHPYRDFLDGRLVGIAASSLVIAHASVVASLTVAMFGASLFISSHFYIYAKIYWLERKSGR